MTQPPLDPYLEYRKSPAGIREIAQRQRAILLCILAIFILYVPAIGMQQMLPLLVRLGLAFAVLVVDIVAVVFVFLLTTKLYGVGVGILVGILTLIPCVGLITLLVVNAKATTILRAAGLKVGLLGASVPDDL